MKLYLEYMKKQRFIYLNRKSHLNEGEICEKGETIL